MRRAGLLICGVAASLVAASGTATAAPTASTDPATNVGSTTATLNGTVNPDKQQVTYHFDYGTTTDYGTSTPNQGPVGGNAGKDVSADITGLQPSTVYHYRLVATYAGGIAFGNDQTFTTLAPGQGPPAAPTVTIAAKPTTVRFGKPTTISGLVSNQGSAPVQVDLESTPFPFTSPFKSIATGTTDATGNYVFANQLPTVNTRYQVTAKTSPPATSPSVQVNVRPAVSLRLNDRTPRRGQRVRFAGEVTPAHNGKVVLIQRHTTKGWRTVSTPTLKATTPGTGGVARSKYVKRIRIRRNGTYRTQIRPGDGDHTRGYSAKRRVRVH